MDTYVVTFDSRPVTGSGAIQGLRHWTLQEARDLRAFAATVPMHGRIVNVETLEVVPA